MGDVFTNRQPNIEGNADIREPQLEAYRALNAYARESGSDREVGIILPVGCGKSGTIAIAPFAFSANRVLVVAPGLSIAQQLDASKNSGL